MRKLSRVEWRKTPYALSEVKDADSAIRKLLVKYGIEEMQWTEGKGPNRRPAVLLRFILKGKGYRLMLETLDADVEPHELMRQIKRAIFYYLKAMLEVATVFFTPEEAMFAFLELPHQQTMFEAAQPHMDKLAAPDFGTLMLPAPEKPNVS